VDSRRSEPPSASCFARASGARPHKKSPTVVPRGSGIEWNQTARAWMPVNGPRCVVLGCRRPARAPCHRRRPCGQARSPGSPSPDGRGAEIIRRRWVSLKPPARRRLQRTWHGAVMLASRTSSTTGAPASRMVSAVTKMSRQLASECAHSQASAECTRALPQARQAQDGAEQIRRSRRLGFGQRAGSRALSVTSPVAV
jgi:hypothetical protein